MPRYRLPVDAVGLIFAAVAIANLLERWNVRTCERANAGTWAMPRYRLPVDAVGLIFAAVGVADLAERWNARTFWRARSKPLER